MRKGASLESQIDALCANVNALGYHAHKNHPHRLASGTYIEGEPYDYEVFLRYDGGRLYHACFDAKECDDEVWHMKKKDLVQAENLKHCQNAGIDAFFLIYFIPLKRLLKIEAETVVKVLKGGRKTVPAALGVPWEINAILQKTDKREEDA